MSLQWKFVKDFIRANTWNKAVDFVQWKRIREGKFDGYCFYWLTNIENVLDNEDYYGKTKFYKISTCWYSFIYWSKHTARSKHGNFWLFFAAMVVVVIEAESFQLLKN